jgi:hypothetical protein
VYQPWIPTVKRSSLLTRIATMEKRFAVRANEKLTAFVELETAIRRSHLIDHTACGLARSFSLGDHPKAQPIPGS